MPKKLDWRSTLKEVAEEKRRRLGPHPGHDKLAAYHAGELGEAEAKALQDHLVLCPQCARLLLDLDAFAADAADPRPNHADSRHWLLAGRWWQVPAAAAAAMLLLVLAWPSAEPLPQYSASLSGNVEPKRSPGSEADKGIYLFAAGRPLSLKLQPPTALHDPLTARAYLFHDQVFRALSASTLEVDQSGVVSLQGVVGTDLLLPNGESELIVSVARPGAVPSRDRLRDELAASSSARGRSWMAFGRKIRVLEPAAGSSAEPSQSPWVEYAGCRTILIGPICILHDDRPLILWVKHRQESEIRIHAGGWWRDSYRGTPVDGGFRFEIEVGNVQEVVVEVVGEDKRLIWALEVRREPERGWRGRVRELEQSGALDEASRLLKERISAANAGDVGFAYGRLARIERRRGLAELGDKHFRAAIAAHRNSGRISEEIHDAAGLSFYFIQERRFSEVIDLLDSLPVDATGGHARSRYYMAYTHGLMAERRGDLRAAPRWMDQAARIAQRAGMIKEWHYALDLMARQRSTAGLQDAAAAIYSQIEAQMASLCSALGADSMLTGCDCARFDVNRAWVGLLDLEAGRPFDGPDPSILLAQAERIFKQEEARGSGCISADDLLIVRLNRALAALHAGDPDEADHHLRQADVDPEAFPRLALWQLDIKARILLEGDQPDQALRRYEELERLAEISSAPDAAWRAAYGSAKAMERLKRDDEAIQACIEADRLLDQESLLVPMHEGRERFIAQREPASRLCLDLLLRANRKEEALAAVRRSAARMLSNLRTGARIADLTEAQRNQWKQAADSYSETRSEIEKLAAQIWKGSPDDQQRRLQKEIEGKRRALLSLLDQIASLAGSGAAVGSDLAPPSGGVLLLAYHPLQQGWAALAADEKGVSIQRIQELPSQEDLEDLSSRLLAPFAEQIERAAEIRVIPYGALRNLDFHALPFGGGILLDQAPVVYHLDLPASVGEDLPTDSALLASGPGLLKAPEEIGEVERILKESRPGLRHVELLDSPAAAEVQRRLADLALFHYAGHAEYDEESRGWGSYLALDGGTRLTVDDILYSPRVPRWVVLSGCETSRDSRTAPIPSIGLAQAFLVAGAEAVVAATAEVSDADAAALMESFYRRWNSSTPMADALQEAQLDLKDSSPKSNWSKFRILARSLP